MGEINQDYGKLSRFGLGLPIGLAVSVLSWVGCFVSFTSLLTGSAFPIFHYATDHQENSTFLFLQSHFNQIPLGVMKVFNLEEGNSTKPADQENPTALFCSMYGFLLLVTLIFVVYFCLLIKTHGTGDKSKVAQYIRRFCYFIAISKILLSFRYSIVYILEFSEDGKEEGLEGYAMKALLGMGLVIFPLDIIAGVVILHGTRKAKKMWLTGVLFYVIVIFFIRLAIYLALYLNDDDKKKHLIPLCLHIFFFSFSYMFLVIHHGLMCKERNSTQFKCSDNDSKAPIVMKGKETKRSSEKKNSVESPGSSHRTSNKAYQKSYQNNKDNKTALNSRDGRNTFDRKDDRKEERKDGRKPADVRDGRNMVDKKNGRKGGRNTVDIRDGRNMLDRKDERKDGRNTADNRDGGKVGRNTVDKKNERKDGKNTVDKRVKTNEDLGGGHINKNIGIDDRRMTVERGAKVKGWIEEGGQSYWGLIHDRALYLYTGQNDRANNEKPREKIQLNEGRRETKSNTILIILKSGEIRRFQVDDISKWNLALDESFGDDIYINDYPDSESEFYGNENEGDYENYDENETGIYIEY